MSWKLGIEDIKLPEVRLFRSAQEYQNVTGKPVPEWDRNWPIKMWDIDPGVKLANLQSFNYVGENEKAEPIIYVMTFPASILSKVNIPPEGTILESYNREYMSFPVRALTPDEVLVMEPQGPKIYNLKLKKQEEEKQYSTFEQAVIGKLDQILLKLK